MPAVEAASTTLIRGEKPFTAAYDGQLALDADELQYQKGYGPCIDAGLSGQVLVVDVMATDERWPDYGRNAASHGIGSSLSVPLPFQTATLGALNTYSTRRHAIGRADRALGQEVASWIALAVGTAETVARTSDELKDMLTAMKSRAVIEQAKGMGDGEVQDQRGPCVRGVSPRLRETSNIKLRDVAQDLINTGTLRGAAPLRSVES